MVVYCILIGLAVYYAALWIWYRRTDNRTSRDKADGVPFPQEEIPDYTLIGESRYKGGQIDPQPDKAGHLPQAVENDTIFAPEAAGTGDTLDNADDESDYEDEEIAGYMAGDDAGRATGVSFEELGEAVRMANADTSTEAEQRQAAGTLARIEGTNLYDAVVENINGGLARVAELLKRNEAELAPAAVPAATADTDKEYGAFDMNEYL
ncbi:hypothetical protein IX307_002404 [Bacteroides pyogenes]|uniref:hypothetical protein n=1 Tax=Bacteroides pyogenes TaxID=310300 RepID=UPI001BA516C5|nr:hypothetical protein [Bacteroides pyogenes]MBR8721179.1 hypothetical protein [Bacteroides pyogenes]MBR8788066.1 hypothetical protein [Bacteroides pyogenes]MBR8793505.1 hypothetical protein [Bacteroides pyogenes]